MISLGEINDTDASDKGFRGTTQRACPPEETLRRIKPFLPLAGITRLADITGLDRIGIPVTLAIRPNARTVVGSTGKGPTLVTAMVSGAMEAIEMFHAEHADLPVLEVSLDGIHADGMPVIATHNLPLVKHQRLLTDQPIPWVWGEELVSVKPMLVPFSTVHLKGRRDAQRIVESPFQRSSNGLASGNIRLEAVLAGMYELIERDAYALARAVPGFWSRQDTVVDLQGVSSAVISDMVGLLEEAGVAVVVHDMTSDLGVPAFAARLFDLVHPEYGTAVGYGCHLETEVALVRAITEAVQGRAVVQVAGSRDDTTKYERWTMKLFASEAQLCRRLLAGATHVPAMHRAGATFEADFMDLVGRLHRQGMDEVVVVDLQQAPFPVSVVRVLIPGLEGIWTFPFYAPGDRARKAVARGAEVPL